MKTGLELEGGHANKASRKEKDKYYNDLTHMWDKKVNKQTNRQNQEKQSYEFNFQTCGLQTGRQKGSEARGCDPAMLALQWLVALRYML